MGNNPASKSATPILNKNESDELESSTHCMSSVHKPLIDLDDQNELKELYRQWKKEVPSGLITKKDFKEFLRGRCELYLV